MNLTLFFRLIMMSIFQSQVIHDKTNRHSEKMSYDNQLFYCPIVFAKDGFNISLQVHNSNYCTSEKGYKEFGHTMEEVEFGFPSEDDVLLHKYSEMYDSSSYNDNNEEITFDETNFTSVGTVGRIPVSVLEELFVKHGGIDWEKTISTERFIAMTKDINSLNRSEK